MTRETKIIQPQERLGKDPETKSAINRRIRLARRIGRAIEMILTQKIWEMDAKAPDKKDPFVGQFPSCLSFSLSSPGSFVFYFIFYFSQKCSISDDAFFAPRVGGVFLMSFLFVCWMGAGGDSQSV